MITVVDWRVMGLWLLVVMGLWLLVVMVLFD
jgi:hypothetical protein